MTNRFQFDLRKWRNPRVVTRLVLGALLLANLVAAAIVFKPWAASVGDMEREAAGLRQQIRQKQMALDRLRGLVKKVQSARSDGDGFMDRYLMSKRTVASTLLDELDQTARKTGIKQKEASYNFEPVEGNESLMKATITATYEGTYADLVHFINALDRSPRFLIIESLAAAPQQTGLQLGTTMRLNAFVREGGPAAAPPATAQGGEEEKPAQAPAPPPSAERVAAKPSAPAARANGPAVESATGEAPRAAVQPPAPTPPPDNNGARPFNRRSARGALR